MKIRWTLLCGFSRHSSSSSRKARLFEFIGSHILCLVSIIYISSYQKFTYTTFFFLLKWKSRHERGGGGGRPLFVCVASIETCFREINCNVRLNWMWKLALEINVKIILWTSWNNHCQHIPRSRSRSTRGRMKEKKNISGQTSWYWFHNFFSLTRWEVK